jgi:hypothetical protein
MNAKTFYAWLVSENACVLGLVFAENKTLSKVWQELYDPRWMIWLLEKSGAGTKINYVRIAVYAAELFPENALGLGRMAIDLAKISLENDTYKTRYETARAARMSGFATPALNAASAAAWAASWAPAASAARLATVAADRDKICDYIRSLISAKDIEAAIKKQKLPLDAKPDGA